MLKQKLQDEQIISLKAKDAVRLQMIRYIIAQINNKEINTQKPLTDEEIVGVMQKIKKELNESIDSFTKGNRPDLVEESKKQMEIVNGFLPAELSDEELKKEVAALIEKNKELYEKKPASIIGICIKELKSKADSSRIMKTIQSFKT